MKEKPKFLFLNNMAAPYQVKLCYALQDYFNAEFWFYVRRIPRIPVFWEIPLGEKCKVLDHSFYLKGFNHNNFHVLGEIKKFAPDIILLGGFFFPTHYLIKRWAGKHNIKVIMLSEKITYSSAKIASKIKHLILKMQLSLFRDADLFFAMGEKPRDQFIQNFGFPESKVVVTQYPQDIDENLRHPLRKSRPDSVLILPNRLDPMYNPLFVLDVFLSLSLIYPEITLMMNSSGSLKEKCTEFIIDHNLFDRVHFIEGLRTWDDLHDVYAKADIALFAATDSNGPNTLIECMASGCGIVMSTGIYNTEAYAFPEENCFIRPMNKDAFMNAVRRYLDDPELLPAHGAISKKAVVNRSISATAHLYHQIISSRFPDLFPKVQVPGNQT